MPIDRITGARISTADHVDQCVLNILQTPLLSRPMDPEYGADLLELVDLDMGRSGQAHIRSSMAESVTQHESRPEYDRITVDVSSTGEVVATLYWTLDSEAFTTEVAP